MDVAPEISTVTDTTVPISETVDATVIAKRSAQTRVAINNGQTIIIGGFISSRDETREDKVPILGDIPLLGFLFRNTVKEKRTKELLMFLTPTVLRDAEKVRGELTLPPIDGLRIQGPREGGVNQTIINGKYSRSITYQYIIN